MIKAIVTDVDGVIVGKQVGNFPLPNDRVIQALKQIHARGIPIVLCTAKFSFAVREIIKRAELRGPHITDGGALIINPLNNEIIKSYFLDQQLATQLVEACLEKNIYLECVGIDDYLLQKNQMNNFTEKRIAILQKEHIAVTSLLEQLKTFRVLKILAFAKDKKEKLVTEEVLQPFLKNINFLWSTHPTIFPVEGAVITVKGVSKKDATLEVLKHLGISPEDTLGIGDTLGDWNFMQSCGYVGVTGGESNKLIAYAHSKGPGKYFLANDADHDGFLKIASLTGLLPLND